MDSEIISRWEYGKDNLRKYFTETPVEQYNDNYARLVEVLITECLNHDENEQSISTNFVRIDDGEYQGMEIYILHYDTYQPHEEEYFIFTNYYGSCSACDTLRGINVLNNDKYANEEQINEYMTLCLHMVQRMKRLGDCLYDFNIQYHNL